MLSTVVHRHSRRMVLSQLLILVAFLFCFSMGCPTFILATDFIGTPYSIFDDNGYYNHQNADSGLGRRGYMSWLHSLTSVRVNKVVNGLIIVLALLNIIVYRLKKLQEGSFAKDDKPSSLPSEYPCRQFSFAEIKLATNNFDQRLVIGKGGFGTVYKGFLDHGASCVAIKRLESWSRQGASEFWTEIKMLSRLRHSHLVSLIGYCNEFTEMILVYEYVSSGNLEDHLNKKGKLSGDSPLSWVQRLKICIGAARALDYLHTGTGVQQRIIHRDVKSSNILLDENLAPKISDLGVSRIGPANQPCTHVSTEVKGSFGYFDPDYFHTGRLTKKSDVYAFGVVLLEILTGRRAVDLNLKEEEHCLVEWAKHCIKEGTLDQIIDAHLKGQILRKCLKIFLKTVDKCLRDLPQERPTMAEVVLNLESALALQERMHIKASDQRKNQSHIKSVILAFSRMLRSLFSPKPQVISGMSNDDVIGAEMCATSSSVHVQVGDSGNTVIGEVLQTAGLKVYSYADLKSATRNFNSDMVLGEGGFGRVYKGWLDEKSMLPSKHSTGMPVAIKKLNPESLQGLEEWQSEVNFLGRLSHPNLVKLLGYCWEDKHLLLVYEYMAKGSVENHLFRSKNSKRKQGNTQPLAWDLRLKIAIDAARGLAFLHNLDVQIIYRDFKASNILLDSNYNAKLSDFGMAKLGPSAGMSHVTTRVMGTYGYAAPEYIATGHLYVKSDVYGFGIVLLEMMTGLRVLDSNRPSGQVNLVDWAKPLLANRKKLKTIIDERIEGQYSNKAASIAAQLTLKCLEHDPKRRPDMKDVVEVLEQIHAMRVKPKGT